MPMEIFTQPCAEQRKSLVEQTEEITVESLLENNDIQPLGNKLRFLGASLKRELLLKEVTLSFFVGRIIVLKFRIYLIVNQCYLS